LFIVPQWFLDDCLHFCVFGCDDSEESKQADKEKASADKDAVFVNKCPPQVRSRVVGFLLDILDERMTLYSAPTNHLLTNTKKLIAKLFTYERTETYQIPRDFLNVMTSAFVMFPDMVPIAFVRLSVFLLVFKWCVYF